MTRLLVSVRSPQEACLAAEAGVDLIDLKEPRQGSLGCVGLGVARRICDGFAGSRPLSMALGELADWCGDDWKRCAAIPAGIVFAKIGLARCARSPSWRALWQRAVRSLPAHCRSVAVIYADWRRAMAPEPQSVLDEAVENGCHALLIDTWRKDAGHVFAHCILAEVAVLFAAAKKHGMLTVLAGSLKWENLDEALSLVPDYVAVRGAVCDGLREGELCPGKVARWADRLHQRPTARANQDADHGLTHHFG